MERSHRSHAQTQNACRLRKEASRVERRLWPYLARSQTGAPFRRQHPVGPFYPDYFCVPLKLAVEVDGPLHDRARDAARDAHLSALGVTIVRFSAQEVEENLAGVVDRIREEVWLLQQTALHRPSSADHPSR